MQYRRPACEREWTMNDSVMFDEHGLSEPVYVLAKRNKDAPGPEMVMIPVRIGDALLADRKGTSGSSRNGEPLPATAAAVADSRPDSLTSRFHRALGVLLGYTTGT